MSKYGNLSRTAGHSSWFLQKTLRAHDESMDHPWMQMIYKQSFSVPQYAAWLARNYAVFKLLEAHLNNKVLSVVHDAALLRTAALEADLQQLLGPDWQAEAASMATGSPATASYLEHLQAESQDGLLVLSHHFLQYNAVLSGGEYLGKMVAQKLCVLRGAPGTKFYVVDGVPEGKGAARVQKYLRDFDTVEITTEDRDRMLTVMKRIYQGTVAMMSEVFELNPAAGISYVAAKDGAGAAGTRPPPLAEQLELELAELHGFTGADGGRILMSIQRELIDVSNGRELYQPGGSYSLLAGRDVTRCLGTMSLDEKNLDDLEWRPQTTDEEECLNEWLAKLKEKYPVAGRLSDSRSTLAQPSEEGVRQRKETVTIPPSTSNGDAQQACPISGKVGDGCPMAKFGIIKPREASATAAEGAKPGAKSGFMAGKSLIGSVQKSSSSYEDTFLYRICPLHWDDATTKVMSFIAAVAWVSGIFVGWNLRKVAME